VVGHGISLFPPLFSFQKGYMSQNSGPRSFNNGLFAGFLSGLNSFWLVHRAKGGAGHGEPLALAGMREAVGVWRRYRLGTSLAVKGCHGFVPCLTAFSGDAGGTRGSPRNSICTA
jgi:hypothetical protein